MVKNLPAIWETWVWSLGQEDPLDHGMAWHGMAWQPTPVFLPREPPWTKEPGRLQSMGSQRVRHDWVTKYSTGYLGFSLRASPGGSDGKESVYNAGDLGSITGLERCPGERNGNPLRCSCLENPVDLAIAHGVAKSKYHFHFQASLFPEELNIAL